MEEKEWSKLERKEAGEVMMGGTKGEKNMNGF